MRILNLTVLLITILVGCQRPDKHGYITIKKINVNIETDGVSPIPYNHFTVNSFENEGILVGYSSANHILNIYNLTNNKISRQIKLDNEGPNGIGKVTQIILLSQNKLVIVSQTDIIFFDLNDAEVLNRLSIYDIFRTEWYPDQKVSFFGEEIIMAKKQPTINKKHDQFNVNLFSVVKGDGSYYHLPVKYLEIMRENFYPTMDLPYFSCVNDLIFYNFPYSSEVYSYDIKEENLTVHPGTFSGEPKRKPGIDPKHLNDINKAIAYNVNGYKFSPLLYDHFKDQYYRLHANYTPLENKNDFKRESSLTVFDKNLTVIYESKLDFNPYSLYFSFVTEKGLWLNIEGVEDELNFKVLNIESG